MKIGVYLGMENENTENIENQLIAWGNYLDEYNLQAFGSAMLPDSCEEYYTGIEISPSAGKNPLTKIVNAYREGKQYLRKQNPDVIIQITRHNTHGPGIALAGARTDTKVITRFTGDSFNTYKFESGLKKAGVYSLHNLIGRVPLSVSDRIIALGPHMKRQLIAHGASKNKIDILPPSLPLEDRFCPPAPPKKSKIRRDLGIPEDKYVVLYVGRISERKGTDFLETVINTLHKKELFFLFVGDGEYKNRLANSVPEDKVKFTGYIQYSEIDKYYKASDLYVHPSPYEGIPLVILEALKCGLPVVARDAGDIGFILDNTITSPKEMVDMIKSRPTRPNCVNCQYFSEDFQKSQLKSMLGVGNPDA